MGKNDKFQNHRRLRPGAEKVRRREKLPRNFFHNFVKICQNLSISSLSSFTKEFTQGNFPCVFSLVNDENFVILVIFANFCHLPKNLHKGIFLVYILW